MNIYIERERKRERDFKIPKSFNLDAYALFYIKIFIIPATLDY